VARAVAINIMVFSNLKVRSWICKNNFLVNVINCATWLIIDFAPFATIFYLHWKNFSQEAQKQHLLEHKMTASSEPRISEDGSTMQSSGPNGSEEMPSGGFIEENEY